MNRQLRVLAVLALAAVAVPLVPFLIWGTRIDRLVADWLDPPPPPPVLAALEVGVLAADILLPVPSSMVTTLGGAALGILPGTLCGWLGMTLGAVAGYGAGRWGGRGLDDVAIHDPRGLGTTLVVLTRPVPLVAEAAALMAGATRMPLRRFLLAAGLGNLAVAAAWSVAGRLGHSGDVLQWVLVASLALPLAIAGSLSRAGRPLR